MWSGWRAVGVVGNLWCLVGCIVPPSATPSPPSTSAAPSPPPAPAPQSAPDLRVLRVDISAAGVAIAGEQVGSDPEALETALGQADVSSVDVRAATDAPPSLVLAALTLPAGPRVAERSLTWQGVSLKVSNAHRPTRHFGDPVPASVFSWRANGATQLWSISLGPWVSNLGPYEPNSDAEPSVISSLRKECEPTGCSLDVELRQEHLLPDLQAWARVASAVGASLELRVRATPPPPPEPQDPKLGRLPPEVIQAVVRLGFVRFKTCYERGLGRDPNLQGRVSVSFVIARDGTVKNASDSGSDLPDAVVRDCVVEQFERFRFPAPEGGTVDVVYPILLAPG